MYLLCVFTNAICLATYVEIFMLVGGRGAKTSKELSIYMRVGVGGREVDEKFLTHWRHLVIVSILGYFKCG